MAFDGRSVVEEGGRVTAVRVPYEAGQKVDVRVEPRPEPNRPSAAEVVADLRAMARWLKKRHPDCRS